MTQHILVTGASGVLGQELVPQLLRAGYMVRAMSRSQRAGGGDVCWAQADLATGAGLAEAVAGMHTIIHAASLPGKHAGDVDVEGTRRLLACAQDAGVRHIVYVSIVGIDRIPVAFYRQKLAAEQAVMQGGVPWSIQRATQFHQFIDGILRGAARLPVLPLPTDFRAQPVDPADVATHLCRMVARGPVGRCPDYGGPSVRTLGELAKAWLAARSLRRPVLHVPLPGRAARALRHGDNCCPAGQTGQLSWEAWLHRTYSAASAPSLASSLDAEQ